MKNTLIVFIIIALITSKQARTQTLTLDKCLEYALEHNRDLLAKESQLPVRELESKSAMADLLPKITGNSSLDRYWQIPVQVFPGQLLGQPEGTFVPVRLGTPWMGSLGVEANVNLIDASAWQKMRLTALQKQLAAGELNSLKKILLKNVRMAYMATQLYETDITLTQQRYDDYKESHRLVSLQFDKGLTDKITLNQSGGILANLGEAVSESRSALKIALLDLKFWMGYPMEDSIAISGGDDLSFTGLATDPFNTELLPDQQVYQIRQEIAHQQYISARSAWYPRLSLKSGYNRLGFGQSIDFIGNSKWFSSGFVGLKLTIPLLDLDQMLYEPRKKKALVRTAESERSQYRQEQQRDYLKEETLLKESQNTIKIQEGNRALAIESQQLSTRKLEKGVINVIELKQIQDELSQVQHKLLSAKLEYLRHYVSLQHLQNN